MSEFAPPRTYWNPYTQTQEPVLTQEQIDGMWPNKKTDRETLDASMPTLPKEDRAAMAHVEGHEEAVHFEWPLDAPQLDPRQPPSDEALAATVANILTAPERGADMVHLPRHYARFKIEPIRFICENKLDFFQGNVIKYICRHDAKNGIEDIDKVIRYATMYKKWLTDDPDWWK